MLPRDSLFKKRICAWSEHFIRSEPKTALFGSRPLKESSGRAQILAEKGDWRGLLALLIARGENRLFSPEKSGQFVFAEPAFALSAKRTVTILVFRLRRKTTQKQKQIASDRKYNSERFAARAPRITTSVKQERLKRTVFPKRVNVPLLLKETAF